MWWFTADQHFGHFNIIKHCNRPFNTLEEMENDLIKSLNRYVESKDVLVILGDWCMLSKVKMVYDKYTRHIPGNKIFVKGNHDWWFKKEKRHLYHRKVYEQGMAMSHYPMRTWKNHQHGWWNLHGHSHGTLPPIENQLDVGVDVAYKLFGEFRPFSYDDLEHLMDNQKIVLDIYE